MRYLGSVLSPLLLCMLLNSAPASAAELGRLFLTREQRANLDDIRYQSKFAPPAEPEPAPVVKSATPVPQTPVVSSLMINGIVRPSRGAGTVWLNNQQVERGGVTREGIRVTTERHGRGGVRIKLPSGADTIVLKPGQKIDVATGSVLEAYEADPHKNAKSAFAPGTGESTGELAGAQATAPDSAAAPPSADQTAAGSSAKLTRERMLELLRDSKEKLPDTPGKALSP